MKEDRSVLIDAKVFGIDLAIIEEGSQEKTHKFGDSGIQGLREKLLLLELNKAHKIQMETSICG